MRDDLSEEISRAIKNIGNHHTYERGKYSVTELVLCPFKPYYKRHPGACDIEREVTSLMVNGTMMHEKLEKVLKEFPGFKNAEFEVKLSDVHMFPPSCDRIEITAIADAVTEDAVWEFKYSSKSTPSAFQYKQANAYAVMAKKKKYYIIMVNNFTLDVSIHEGTADDGMYGYMVDNAYVIEKSLEGKIIISGPMYEWECYYCEFRGVCECRKGNG